MGVDQHYYVEGFVRFRFGNYDSCITCGFIFLQIDMNEGKRQDCRGHRDFKYHIFSIPEALTQPLVVMESDPKLNHSDILASDWLDAGEAIMSPSNQTLRQKRSPSEGAAIEDTMFSLTEVASETVAADQAELGDSWTFELAIELPQLDSGDMADIKIELFGLDPDYGLSCAAAGRRTREPKCQNGLPFQACLRSTCARCTTRRWAAK